MNDMTTRTERADMFKLFCEQPKDRNTLVAMIDVFILAHDDIEYQMKLEKRHNFICNSIKRLCPLNNAMYQAGQLCIALIESRLGYYTTIDGWLFRTVPEAEALLASNAYNIGSPAWQSQVDQYRLRWIKSIIAELDAEIEKLDATTTERN